MCRLPAVSSSNLPNTLCDSMMREQECFVIVPRVAENRFHAIYNHSHASQRMLHTRHCLDKKGDDKCGSKCTFAAKATIAPWSNCQKPDKNQRFQVCYVICSSTMLCDHLCCHGQLLIRVLTLAMNKHQITCLIPPQAHHTLYYWPVPAKNKKVGQHWPQ